jgi:hypothetical protein
VNGPRKPLDLIKIPLNEYGHVQTKDGRQAKIICNNMIGHGNIVAVALLKCGDGGNVEQTAFYSVSGETIQHSLCLVPVKKKAKVNFWLNVYKDRPDATWETRAAADLHANRAARIACIHIEREVEEGEGLE